MMYEVETNRLIHLFTPLIFGWTISLNSEKEVYYFHRFALYRHNKKGNFVMPTYEKDTRVEIKIQTENIDTRLKNIGHIC
jgi:hypothetical protein